MSVRAKLLMLVLVAASCATPMPPTGGPPDRTGPVVLGTKPEDGSTGFKGRDLEIRFDEHVDIVGFRNALRFEPDLQIAYRVRWSGKTARIRLEDPLPPNTTMVMVVDPELKDARGNAMGNPLRVAFSSGDRIDQGAVSVRVLHPETGRRAEQIDVFLYREGADFSQPATYTSQTDTGGHARFRYLPPDTYRIIAVQDRNRNRTWDQGRESAFPWLTSTIEIPADSALTLGNWFAAATDTIRPALDGIGQTGPERMRLRFSKPVESGRFTLVSDADTVQAYALHPERNDRSIWFYAPEAPVRLGTPYRLMEPDIADSLGNRLRPTELVLDFDAMPDTVRQRVVETVPDRAIDPDEAVVLVLAKPVVGGPIRDSLRVFADRQPITDVQIRPDRNRLVLTPALNWPEGVVLNIQTYDEADGRTIRRSVRVRQSGDVGDLSIVAPDSVTTFVVDVRTMGGAPVRRVRIIDQALISELPAGRYMVTGFMDANGNGRFDTGTVVPFQAPESFHIELGVVIRAGFEAELRFR